MEPTRLSEILLWTDAGLVNIFERDPLVSGLSTDSRTIGEGEVFLALTGERFDGHEFVGQAFARGACAAIVESSRMAALGKVAGPLLVVPSALEALGSVARHYRRRFELPVVAIVGSSGKTTTKELAAAVLGRRYRVLKNQGNENNEIGVPRTLLRLDRRHEAVVIELAARKVGDIRYLCSVVQPTIGVLLNIGTAHLEYFGSVERVAEAKGEILDYLDESYTALVNVDDCVVANEAKRTKGRLLGFSLRRESWSRGEGLVFDQDGGSHFSLQNYSFDLRIPGRHNIYNALAAAGIGRLLEVPWEDIRQALADFQPVAMRSEILRKDGICVIDDSYNANPDSVAAALKLLGSMAGKRKIAVLGDMLELGPRSAELHATSGRQALAAGIELLLATGAGSLHTVEGARKAGMVCERAIHFADQDKMLAAIRSMVQPGDVVLIKGSRAMGLERIAEAIGR